MSKPFKSSLSLAIKNYLARRARKPATPEPPIDFDGDWYLKTYPDVAASGIDAMEHFIQYGRAEGRLGSPMRAKMRIHRTFDPSKKSVLLVSHDASLSGAPIVAFNLLEKFALKFNVISVLLGPGCLEAAFQNNSVVTLGPFSDSQRHSVAVHGPILDICRQFSPSFAVVNTIESREALIPLREAGVPSILLVHEFASLWRIDMKKIATDACQMVFPARLVWQDAVDIFPPLAFRSPNILPQGSCRVPREWINGEVSEGDEKKLAASVMKPLGAEDDAVVVIGCGTIETRKGVDLFISTAYALKRLSPSRPFRFVWVGNNGEHLFSRYLAEQIDRCGLRETVRFLPELKDLDQAYAMADMFLLSSRLDPFPNVAIGAMLAGLPVVCFKNASGIAEMLSDRDDLKKLVVPYMDAHSAAGIIELLCVDHSYRDLVKGEVQKLALSFDMLGYSEHIESLAQRASMIMSQQEEDAATITGNEFFMKTMPPGGKDSKSKAALVKSWVCECAAFGGAYCPFPGFDLEIYRREHPELNEPPFANPLAHFIRSGRPGGPWLGP